MRRFKLIFAGMLIFSYASGQNAGWDGRKAANHVGADLSSVLITGKTSISVGHAFSRHWSITGEAGIGIPGLRRNKTEEETEHYKELYGHGDKSDNEGYDIITGTASFAYWPEGSLEGIYLRFGLKYGNRTGADCRIGIGYMLPLWKMIYADIRYCMDMAASCRHGTIKGSGTTIGINIIF